MVVTKTMERKSDAKKLNERNAGESAQFKFSDSVRSTPSVLKQRSVRHKSSTITPSGESSRRKINMGRFSLFDLVLNLTLCVRRE